jgi:hypothetical protein
MISTVSGEQQTQSAEINQTLSSFPTDIPFCEADDIPDIPRLRMSITAHINYSNCFEKCSSHFYVADQFDWMDGKSLTVS